MIEYDLKFDENRLPELIKVNEYQDEYPTVCEDSAVHTATVDLKLLEKTEEYMYMIALDGNKRALGVFQIAHGGPTQVPTFFHNIFVRALLVGATEILVIHNHPTGDLTPSKNDIQFTNELIDACRLVGIELTDHLIVGGEDEEARYSFAEEGYVL